MWQKFLMEKVGPFLVPPYFKMAKVKSQGGQNYDITIKSSKLRNNWCWVDQNGNIQREGEYWEVSSEISRYPSVLCSYIKTCENGWIVSVDQGPVVLRGIPDMDGDPLPLSRIRAVLMGKALVFYSFDYRDAFPEIVDNALMMLKREELTDEMPLALIPSQEFAYSLLLEEEKVKRVPQPEKKIKDILNKEGAQLISMKETRDGYSLQFNYKGRRRDITIREDLMLINSGMCLSGRDRDFSLDSFLSILHNRGTSVARRWRDDGLYR